MSIFCLQTIARPRCCVELREALRVKVTSRSRILNHSNFNVAGCLSVLRRDLLQLSGPLTLAEGREPLTPDPPSSISQVWDCRPAPPRPENSCHLTKTHRPSWAQAKYSQSCLLTHRNLCSIFARRPTHRDHPSACIFPFMMSANFLLTH